MDSTDHEGEGTRAPVWPVILQIGLLVCSFAIVIMIYVFSPRIVRENMLLLSLFGYIFTPILTTGLLALTRGQDLKNRSLPGYHKYSGKSRIKLAGSLSLASFLISLPLIWQLATEIVARK